MEQISQLATVKMGPLGTLLLVLIGVLTYNVLTIVGSQRVTRFSQISLKKWWDENQVRITFVTLAVIALATISIKTDTMTAERAITLAMTVNLAVDKILKSFGHDPGQPR